MLIARPYNNWLIKKFCLTLSEINQNIRFVLNLNMLNILINQLKGMSILYQSFRVDSHWHFVDMKSMSTWGEIIFNNIYWQMHWILLCVFALQYIWNNWHI